MQRHELVFKHLMTQWPSVNKYTLVDCNIRHFITPSTYSIYSISLKKVHCFTCSLFFKVFNQHFEIRCGSRCKHLRTAYIYILKSFIGLYSIFYFVETDNLHWQGWHGQDSNFLRGCNQDGGA